jgi:hypothetical protein
MPSAAKPSEFHGRVAKDIMAFFRPDRILSSPSRAAMVKDGACMGLSELCANSGLP